MNKLFRGIRSVIRWWLIAIWEYETECNGWTKKERKQWKELLFGKE